MLLAIGATALMGCSEAEPAPRDGGNDEGGPTLCVAADAGVIAGLAEEAFSDRGDSACRLCPFLAAEPRTYIDCGTLDWAVQPQGPSDACDAAQRDAWACMRDAASTCAPASLAERVFFFDDEVHVYRYFIVAEHDGCWLHSVFFNDHAPLETTHARQPLLAWPEGCRPRLRSQGTLPSVADGGPFVGALEEVDTWSCGAAAD